MGNEEYGPPPIGNPTGAGATGDHAWGADPLGTHQPQPPAPDFAPPPVQGAQYPPPPYQGGQYPPPMMPPVALAWKTATTERNWMGITSLVLGCIGGGIPGIVFGALGISAAKQGRATNKTMATWGLVLNIVMPILIVGFWLGTGALAGAFDSDRVDYDDLAVGDCIQEPPGWNDEGSDLDSLQVVRVECSDDHWGQLYYTAPLAGTDYPSDEEATSMVEDLCFSDAAAENIADAHLDDAFAYYIMPTELSWKSGDRDAFCFVSDENHTATGSWVVGS